MDRRLTFDARFEGPPGGVNGGVLAGTLAGDGPAEVTIRRPVPLDTELRFEGHELRDAQGEVLARVTAAEGFSDLRAPRVSLAAARAAGASSPLRERHPFPRCFGCGPAREDGLGLLPGPVDGRGPAWAVDWVPAEVSPPVVWAALDCPSSAPVVSPTGDPPYVLGRIAAHLLGPVEAGEPHVVVSWELGRDGRRAYAGSAVLGPDGEPRAIARATWVALR